MEDISAVKRIDDPYTLAGLHFFGFSLFACWVYFLFSGFLDDAFSFEGLSVWSTEMFLPFFVLLGVAGGLGIAFLLSNRFRAGFYRAGLILGSFLSTVYAASLIAYPIIPEVLFGVFGLLAGAATGFLFVCWIILLSRSASSQTCFLYSIALVLAVLLGFLLAALPLAARNVCFVLCFVFSCVIQLFLTRHHPVEEQIDRKTSRARRPLFWKTHITFDVFGAVFGLCFFELVQNHASLAAITIALLGGAAVAVIDIWQAGGVYPDRMRRLTTAVMLAVLLAASFLVGEYQVACWFVIVGLLSYFFVIQPNWTILAGRKYQLNVASLVPEGQIQVWTAMALGWLLGGFCAWYSVNTTVPLLVLAVLLVGAMLLYRVDDFADLRLVESEIEGTSGKPKARRFIERCEQAAKVYRLTPRETEVLILLAKGRNAEFICNKLIISMHTAKTHIYHIYQKMGVGSQQALLDKVEKL